MGITNTPSALNAEKTLLFMVYSTYRCYFSGLDVNISRPPTISNIRIQLHCKIKSFFPARNAPWMICLDCYDWHNYLAQMWLSYRIMTSLTRYHSCLTPPWYTYDIGAMRASHCHNFPYHAALILDKSQMMRSPSCTTGAITLHQKN